MATPNNADARHNTFILVLISETQNKMLLSRAFETRLQFYALMQQSPVFLIVQDPRAARPYLFSDGQNMYYRVVLVCTVNYTYPLTGADG